VTELQRRVTMRIAEENDAPRLSTLAARLFRQTYVGSISTDVLDPHIVAGFGEIQQRTELLDPNITTLLVEIENEMVGYAQLRLKPIPVPVALEVSAELWRVYVDRSRHGLGIGRQLLTRVGELAAEMSHEKIWLGVWERNLKAIAFYKKLGFNEVGCYEFHMDVEIQNVLVFMGSTSVL
jgi:ribosomal protein S18 acetylase RimI-like enzyme